MEGCWITLDWKKDAEPVGSGFMAFRKNYVLKTIPQSCILYVAASPGYRFWINGRWAADGNIRSFSSEKILDLVDISEYLAVGTNTFCFVVSGQTGASGYSVVERSGLFMKGIMKWENREETIRTDASWEVRKADWYAETPFFYSIPIGKTEHYLADREPLGWKTAADDQNGWKQVFVLGGEGTPPWKHMRKCDIKPFSYTYPEPELIWCGQSPLKKEDIFLENLGRNFNRFGCTGKKVFSHEKDFFCSKDTNVYCFDVKKTIYAYAEITVKAVQGDIRLEIFYDKGFQNRPSCSEGFDSPNEYAGDSFTPASGRFFWRSFLPRGFHFITVRMTGEGTCSFQLKAVRQEYPYGPEKQVSFCDPMLRRIWDISGETLKSGTTDVIGEPFRENVLWTFDACVGGQAAYDTFGDADMWRHCLRLIGQGIDEDGIPKSVVPGQYSFMILFDQAFYWVVSCRDYVMRVKDMGLADELLPSVRRFLALCAANISRDGFFVPPSYAWHWIDWADVNKKPYALPVNAMFLWALQACITMGELLDKDMRQEQNTEKRLREKLAVFYDEDRQAFRSRIPAPEEILDSCHNSVYEEQSTEVDAYGNALAWWTHIGTEDQRKAAVRELSKLIMDGRPGRMEEKPAMGIGWTQILLQPLLNEGYEEEVKTILRKYYGPCIQCGTATWGEDFSPEPFNTAHAWGACINILLAQMQE